MAKRALSRSISQLEHLISKGGSRKIRLPQSFLLAVYHETKDIHNQLASELFEIDKEWIEDLKQEKTPSSTADVNRWLDENVRENASKSSDTETQLAAKFTDLYRLQITDPDPILRTYLKLYPFFTLSSIKCAISISSRRQETRELFLQDNTLRNQATRVLANSSPSQQYSCC